MSQLTKGNDMAQKTTIRLVDDLDGSDGVETVTFGLDGRAYEIDLNEDNATLLRDALAEYVGAGRRVSTRGAGQRSSGKVVDQSEARKWAKAKGYSVSDRGRVASTVLEEFNNRPR